MMSPAEHRAAWMGRYASDYATDAERSAAYEEHQRVLAVMRDVFGDGIATARYG